MSASATDPEALRKQAQDWAEALIAQEKRTWGKKELALESLADRINVSKGAIWGLLYRPPSDVGVSLYKALEQAYAELEGAYEHERQRQRGKYNAEARAARPTTGFSRALARAADAVARRDLGVLT